MGDKTQGNMRKLSIFMSVLILLPELASHAHADGSAVQNSQLKPNDFILFTRKVPGPEAKFSPGSKFKFKGLKEPTDDEVLASVGDTPPTLDILEGPDGKQFTVNPAEFKTLQLAPKEVAKKIVASKPAPTRAIASVPASTPASVSGLTTSAPVTVSQLKPGDFVKFTRKTAGVEAKFSAGSKFKFKGLKEPTDDEVLASVGDTPPTLAILEGPDGQQFNVNPAEFKTLQLVTNESPRKETAQKFVEHKSAPNRAIASVPTPVQHSVPAAPAKPVYVDVTVSQLHPGDVIKFTRKVPGPEAKLPAGSTFKFQSLKEPTDDEVLASVGDTPPTLAILEGPDSKQLSVNPAEFKTLQLVLNGNAKGNPPKSVGTAPVAAPNKKTSTPVAAAKASAPVAPPAPASVAVQIAQPTSQVTHQAVTVADFKRREENLLQYERELAEFNKNSLRAIETFKDESASFTKGTNVKVTRTTDSNGQTEVIEGQLGKDLTSSSKKLTVVTGEKVQEVPLDQLWHVEIAGGRTAEFPAPVAKPRAEDLPTPWMKPVGSPGVYFSASRYIPNPDLVELMREPTPHLVVRVSGPKLRNLEGSRFEVIGLDEFKKQDQEIVRAPASRQNNEVSVRYLDGPNAGRVVKVDPRDLSYLEISR
jgi:hypothetical protein